MFKDIEFPRSVSEGLVWGPRFSTDMVVEGGGGEVRNQVWEEPRREADAAKACDTEQKRKDLIAFFRIVAGMAFSFKVRDWSDYKATGTEGRFSAVGNGTYQMVKRYTVGSLTHDQTITVPETADAGSGSVAAVPLLLYDAGSNLMTANVDYTLNDVTGIVTPIGSPLKTPTTWTGPYFVMCRFDIDRIALVARTLDVFMTQSIPLVEVRLEDEVA